MPLERASILEQTRYGVHAAAALTSAVTADKRLRSLGLMPTPVEPQDDVTARGFKVPVGSTSQQGKHSTLEVSGRLAFYDLIVALALCLCKPVVSVPSTAVTTKRYAFRPSAETGDDINVITLDNGYGADAASRCAYAALASLSLTFNETECTFGGSGFAQRLAEAGVALASSPTDVPLVPIDADSWSVYVADTVAHLVENTKLTRCFSTTLAMNSRFAPVFVGDSAQQSYVGFAEQANDILGSIDVEQDAYAQQQIMTALRSKSQRFRRIVACGPDIETIGEVTFRHRLQITYSFDYRNPRPGDNQNVKSGEYDLRAIYDSGSDSVLEILVDIDSTRPGASDLLTEGTALDDAQQPTTLIPNEAGLVSG